MRVCYVYQDEYPWDIRADKITASLADAGVPVTILCRNRRGLPVCEHLRGNLEVRRLPRGLTRFDRAIMNFPAFFSPFWIHALKRTVAREGQDLILVRDLPLAPMAWWVGRSCGVPVLLDMAEDYPAMIRAAWQDFGPRPLDWLIRNPSLLARLEAWVLPRLNGILVVSPASRRRVDEITKGHVPVWTVGNTPRLDAVTKGAPHPLADEIRGADGLKLVYVGGLDPGRGIDTVIRALPLVLRESPGKIVFYVLGEGVTRPGLEALSRQLGLESQVKFSGFVDQQHVPGIIAAADIGLIPHKVTAHTDTTLPNKLYDYMAQAKPVVVTHSLSLREIVETYNCGRVYNDADPEALAGCIMELRDPMLRSTLGRAGLEAVQKVLNWNRDADSLLLAVRTVASAGLER